MTEFAFLETVVLQLGTDEMYGKEVIASKFVESVGSLESCSLSIAL